MVISGRTQIIAHLGYPTESFTAPMIYNPWFAARGIDAVVVPMGVRAEHYAGFLRPLFSLSNIRGALVTMPHKVTTAGMLDRVSTAVEIAGACNAILRCPDGSLYGEMFDGIGFTRAAKAQGFTFAGAACLIVGAGGVGSAIAAAIAPERPGSMALYDIRDGAVDPLQGVEREFGRRVGMLQHVNQLFRRIVLRRLLAGRPGLQHRGRNLEIVAAGEDGFDRLGILANLLDQGGDDAGLRRQRPHYGGDVPQPG